MKKIYLTLFVCCFTATIFAQEKSSLIRENDQIESNDKVKIEQVSKIQQNNAAATVVTYDFTVAGAAYTTGPDPMVEVATGVYAMIAGDASGDGVIDSDDRSATWNARNSTGVYSNSDVTMDSNIDSDDRSIAWNNRNKITQVPAAP